MVAISRRKRMVTQNIADVSLLCAVMVQRRTFFQEDPSIVFLTVEMFIAPPDKVEVEPCFVVAALVGRADAKSFMGKKECAVKPTFPVPIRFRRFKESRTVRPLAWNRSRSPQWCGAGRHRQSTVSKDLFDGTDVVPVIAPPCSSVEVTGHQVHLFVKHHCTVHCLVLLLLLASVRLPLATVICEAPISAMQPSSLSTGMRRHCNWYTNNFVNELDLWRFHRLLYLLDLDGLSLQRGQVRHRHDQKN